MIAAQDGMNTDPQAHVRLLDGQPAVVWKRLIADTETPVGAALKLFEPGRGDFLLESVEGGETRGRYSLLGLDPDLVFRAEGDTCEVNRNWMHDREAFAALPGGALAELRALVEACRFPVPEALPPALACLVGYFGYGSLVNRATLTTGHVAAHRARLKGWRRTWRPRPQMPALADMGAAVSLPDGATPALLTAHRAESAAIDGLLVIDFAVNLPGIDAREFRYHRRDISLADLEFSDPGHGLGAEIALHVYEARIEHPATEGPAPILRSYLDAVMQGFLREFGADGLHRFVSETDAFHAPIHEDRAEPLYPRAVSLSPAEVELFDVVLGRGASV